MKASFHEEFSRCNPRRSVRGYPVLEEKLGKFFLNETALDAFQSLLEGLDSSFCDSVRRRMIWSRCDVENSIPIHESFKLLINKCRTIIRNNFLWYAMCSKYHSELFNHAMGFNRMHESHVHPFRMGVHQYKKHVSQIRTCKINVEAAPRTCWPLPWVEQSSRW